MWECASGCRSEGAVTTGPLLRLHFSPSDTKPQKRLEVKFNQMVSDVRSRKCLTVKPFLRDVKIRADERSRTNISRGKEQEAEMWRGFQISFPVKESSRRLELSRLTKD